MTLHFKLWYSFLRSQRYSTHMMEIGFSISLFFSVLNIFNQSVICGLSCSREIMFILPTVYYLFWSYYAVSSSESFCSVYQLDQIDTGCHTYLVKSSQFWIYSPKSQIKIFIRHSEYLAVKRSSMDAHNQLNTSCPVWWLIKNVKGLLQSVFGFSILSYYRNMADSVEEEVLSLYIKGSF